MEISNALFSYFFSTLYMKKFIENSRLLIIINDHLSVIFADNRHNQCCKFVIFFNKR